MEVNSAVLYKKGGDQFAAKWIAIYGTQPGYYLSVRVPVPVPHGVLMQALVGAMFAT